MKYSITMKLGGKVSESEGATPLEALEKLKPAVSRGVAIISVQKVDGGETLELVKILPNFQVQRLFSKAPMTRTIALKNTALLFNF